MVTLHRFCHAWLRQVTLTRASSVFSLFSLLLSVAQPRPMLANSASLVGQVRCTKQAMAVFSQRSIGSAVIQVLEPNSPVTLSENTSQDDLIGMSSPMTGFIQIAHLKACTKPQAAATMVRNSAMVVRNSAAQTPPKMQSSAPVSRSQHPQRPQKLVCRQVTQPQGLLIRKTPSLSGLVMRWVNPQSQILLTTHPATIALDSDDRLWVQVRHPVQGWVSDGVRGLSGTNLSKC